jgi:CRP-like cAMP-binding protein
MRTLDTILSEHEFFKNLAPEYLELIAGCSKNVRFNAGEYIFHISEEADQFYIIRHGQVAVEVKSHRGDKLAIDTVQENEVLGWSWLFPPYRWHNDARAMTLTRAIAIDGKCLRDKCDADHDFGYEMMQRFARLITERLQATTLQVLDVYS